MLRGSGGLGSIPMCSAAAVGQQCVPDGTVPTCSQAAVGQSCIPDDASGPPSGLPGASATTLIQATAAPCGNANNPCPDASAGSGWVNTLLSNTIFGAKVNTTPGTAITTTNVYNTTTSTPWFMTWWGLGLLGTGGFLAYRKWGKRSAGKAA